ncbi:hypothetical protein FHT86_006961 [Rhizobium sp. BK313]|jgi:hypothetical protein|uniref:DUF982 domain-containing protein n=1 Tax=Rhizobium sp. BK313 TaxID=2587081 RepID=UPI00105C3965|nr:DUF982 domain-containing protein [Rhizobium sp. BK313]MBB3458635.1 hypothetical protein [Rhizobium sp. BK313]
MAEVIKINFKLAWKVPVYVRLGDGFREKVAGPDAALENLNHRWPECESSWYWAAKRCCLLALRDETSVDLARQAFVDAAAYAKMLA